MLRSSQSLAALLGLLLTSIMVAALPSGTIARKQLTNAQRMARGLPLNKPRRRYDPSRTHRLLPRQSASSDPKFYLEVYKFAQEDPYGYVAMTSTGDMYVAQDDTLAEPFRIPSGANTYDLTVQTFRSSYPYLAWGPWVEGQVGGGGEGALYLRTAPTSDAGQQKASLDGPNNYETSVWNITAIPGSADFRWYNDVTEGDYVTYHPNFYMDDGTPANLYGAEKAANIGDGTYERVIVRYASATVCTLNCG